MVLNSNFCLHLNQLFLVLPSHEVSINDAHYYLCNLLTCNFIHAQVCLCSYSKAVSMLLINFQV